MQHLAGKTAVVTGAASGMGRAFADRFARSGMDVVLADVEGPALEEAAKAVAVTTASHGRRTLAVETDVSDEASVMALAETTMAEMGQVNVVCNNAGVAGGGLLAEPTDISVPDWTWVLGVNLWGVVHGHKAFLPHLLEHGDGHIVNTASMAGHFPGHSAYTASKWAVVGITEGLYHQLAAMGSTVGVSCLCPGWVNTRIADSIRNRPEWAAPIRVDEPSPEDEARATFVRDQLASGRSPEAVAELVQDAIVGNRFWIFTDLAMVANLQVRFDAILANQNPSWPAAALGGD